MCSSAFSRPVLTSSVRGGLLTRLKASPYLGCVVWGRCLCFPVEREVCGLIHLRDDQRQQDMVPELMKLKCAPCQAEEEKTAFMRDGDGWMSDIVSRVLFRLLARRAGRSTRRGLDILALHRKCSPFDISIMGACFLEPCRFRSGFTDSAYSKDDSHSRDHDKCPI